MMNVCKIEDLVEIESENNINQTINGMLCLLESSEEKINAIQEQNWFQRMIYSLLGKNKASLKEIKENKDKIDKYVAEAITEMYKRNMISESYVVSLGNRINEISFSSAALKRQLLEIGSALNEKIESVDHYHVLRGLIDEGKFNEYPELYTLIYIVASCDKRVLVDDDHIWLLEKSLKKAGMLCQDLNIADEAESISKLPSESLEGILIETNRTVFNQSLKKIFAFLNTSNSHDSESGQLIIASEKLFDLLVDDKKTYFEFMENKKREQLAEKEAISDEIDLANVVGVYDKEKIPKREDYLKKRALEGILVIEDETIISKEEIHINNKIKCNASLSIEDSIIYIDENNQSNIYIINGSTLTIRNCLVIGQGVWERPFVKIIDGFFYSENSSYEDCSNFVNGTDSIYRESKNSSIKFSYCEYTNCGPLFIDSSYTGKVVELNNCLFLWKEDTATYKELFNRIIKNPFLQVEGSEGRAIHIKNCSFTGNAFNTIWNDESSGIVANAGFLNCSGGIVEGCTFNDISGRINVNLLLNSSFEVNDLLIEINEVSFCKFADCKNLYLVGDYRGGTIIDGCSFDRITNNRDIIWRGLINVRRDKGGEANIIKNCTFSKVEAINEIILPLIYNNNAKDIKVLYLEKCDFRECRSENNDIIKNSCTSYGFFFGKEKRHDNIITITDCKGL